MNTATSATAAKAPTESAPLFYWNGIRDAEGAKLHPVSYSCVWMPPCPLGTVKITSLTGEDFSAKLQREFDTKCRINKFPWEKDDFFYVYPFHPLHPQVKAVADALDELLRLKYAHQEALEAEKEDIYEAARASKEDIYEAARAARAAEENIYEATRAAWAARAATLAGVAA